MLQIKEIDPLLVEKGLKKLFLNYQSVKKQERMNIKHDLLFSFKILFYELKENNSVIFNWYPYERALEDLKEHYRKYYNLKILKQNDSTLKSVLDAFKKEITYYTVFSKEEPPYDIIITTK